VADEAATGRAEAIEGFAMVLRDLRESVGNPAFREMSGRSRAISHTTLHEAAQGNRLPSWATTVEFVKACGADPDEYRARWEQASRLVSSVSSARRAIHVAIDPEPAPTPRASDNPATHLRRFRHVARGGAAVGVAAVIVLAVGLLTASRGKNENGNGRSTEAAQLSSADCPVRQANPPAAPPAHPGDASAFIADLTLPDCSHIRPGQTLMKVWRLKNVGTVPWVGYSLHRLDLPQRRDQCQTITDVPIDDTEPGALVDIRTAITAPKTAGFCFVRFKTVDAAGRIAFPGSRPVNFQVIVD